MKRLFDVTALIAGALYACAFAPLGLGYFAVLGLSLLFMLLVRSSPVQGLKYGFLFGLASFGIGVSWVFISLYQFGQIGAVTSVLLTLLFVCFWAIFPCLMGYCSVKLMQSVKSRRVQLLVIPLLWVIIEYIRGYWVLNGFPWLQTGYSQLETPLSGYLPIIGGYGVSFLLAFTAMAINLIYEGHYRKTLGCIVILIWLVGAGCSQIAWTSPRAQAIKVTLVQGNISQDQKWRPENKYKTLKFYQEATQAHWDSQVIVWPETAIPALFSEVRDSFLVPLNNEAKLHNADIIISVPMQAADEDKFYNTLLTLGKRQGLYKKAHLLPFGEYLPFQPILSVILDRISLKLGNFLPGENNQPSLQAGGYWFTPSICYEDAFSEISLKGLAESSYLVNVTNDAWFGDSFEPEQHLEIARMRALESGRYMLRATNTGITAIISPTGKVLKQAPIFKPWVLSGEIVPMQGLTPYAKLGGDPPIIYTLITLLAMVIARAGWQRLN
jgi:apolipoprotein N-acyltransferase